MSENPKQLCERIYRMLEEEASRLNSAYDRHGMDNSPESIDPDVCALIEVCADLQRQLDESRSVTDEAPTAVLDAGIDAYRQHRVLRSTPHVTVRAIWRAFRTALEGGKDE